MANNLLTEKALEKAIAIFKTPSGEKSESDPAEEIPASVDEPDEEGPADNAPAITFHEIPTPNG